MSVAAVQWRKEVRQLLPWWSATVLTIAACWLMLRPDLMPTDWLFKWAVGFDRSFLLGAALIAYAAGAVTLGALSLGTEYSHGTLTQLLVQPAARAQILRVKLVVLTLMLAALGAMAFAAWGAEPAWAGIAGDLGRLTLIILPLVCGLLLAPWFTMIGHSVMGGTVFTAASACILWIAAGYIRVPAPLLWTAAALVAVVGPWMTWRAFMRLEVTGNSQSEIDLAAWFSRSGDDARAARTQSPVWLLVRKELRLQQGTLVVSGIYGAVWLAMVVDRAWGMHALTNSPVFVATFVNTALVPLLCGAVTSASERQFGVADWQTLLPIASWKQWAIKAGVALGMAFSLAVLLPELLASIATEAGWRSGMEPVTVVVLCIAAIYVSTLCTHPLRALLATVLVIAVAGAALVILFWLIDRTPFIGWLVDALPVVKVTHADFRWWSRVGGGWLACGFFLLLLAFGHNNHRTADLGWRRLARQGAWLSGYAVGAAFFLILVGRLFANWVQKTGAA